MKKLLVFASLLGCCFVLPYCSPEDDIVRASYDGSKGQEGGPSKIVENPYYGINLLNEMFWGLGGSHEMTPVNLPPRNTNSIERGAEWLPADYSPADFLPAAAAPASPGHFSLGTGLEFVQKGSKIVGMKQRLNYLNLMEDLAYTYSFSNKSAVFGGIGPYIGYGIGGKTGSGSNAESSFGGVDGYKRFDAGLHLMAGYSLPGSLQFSLGYEYGLADKSNDPSDYTSRNRTWSISVGYSLSKLIRSVSGK